MKCPSYGSWDCRNNVPSPKLGKENRSDDSKREKSGNKWKLF